jgi:hypothetical protein
MRLHVVTTQLPSYYEDSRRQRTISGAKQKKIVAEKTGGSYIIRSQTFVSAIKVSGMPDLERKIQVNMRIWPHEREALAKAAAESRTTFNGFVSGLVMSAFESRGLLNARGVLDDAVHALTPLVAEAHSLNMSGDYRRAVGKMLTLMRLLAGPDGPIIGRDRETVLGVIDEIETHERVLEIEANRRFRSMKTGGGAQ